MIGVGGKKRMEAGGGGGGVGRDDYISVFRGKRDGQQWRLEDTHAKSRRDI